MAPVTFNVTAVLGDGSAISGSESADFTLMGESKQSYPPPLFFCCFLYWA